MENFPGTATRKGYSSKQQGYVLIPVVLMLSVIAAVAYLMNVEGAINTNAVGQELEANQARFIAEAGYTEAKWQLAQNTTCSNYDDLPETSFAGQSYSVSLAEDSGSPVLMTANGIMATGATSVMTREVASYQATSLLKLQPGATGIDTYLRDGANKDNNFGASTKLKVNNMSAEEVSLIRFDVSSLPQNSHIISAMLELNFDDAIDVNNAVVDVHRMTRLWYEGDDDGVPPTTSGATYQKYDGLNFLGYWSTPGGDYENTPAASITIPNILIEDYDWDLSALVRSWVSGAQPNFGLLVRASGGTANKLVFGSSDASGQGQHPILRIVYACECGSVCTGSATVVLLVSPASSTKLAGQNVRPAELAEYDYAADSATLVFPQSKLNSVNLDAVHQLANGHYVLSAAIDATLEVFNFAPDDLVVYNPAADTTSLYLNALLFAHPTDINAIHLLDDGHILLSTATAATLGGLSFTPDDVIEYDPAADTATLFFDGSLFSAAENIDAFHLLNNGNFLLSTDSNASLGGISFSPTDLIEYDPVADDASIYTPVFDPGVGMDAISIVNASAPIPTEPPPPAICTGTVLDSFHTRSYSRSDGNISWATDWIEIGTETDGATAGDMQITTDLGGYRLRIQNTDRIIGRQVDLSAYTTATLSFQYRRVGLDDMLDRVKIQIKRTSGPGWDNLINLAGPATDATYQSFSVNIDSYLSATSKFRIRSKDTLDSTDFIYFDNFMICAE